MVFEVFSPLGPSRSARVATASPRMTHDGWDDEDPQQRVEDRVLEAGVGEQVLEVLEAHPLGGGAVLEAVDERQDRRVDQVDDDREERREDVEERLDPLLPLRGQQLGDLVERVEEEQGRADADHDGDQRGERLCQPWANLSRKRGVSPRRAPPGARALDPHPRRRCAYELRQLAGQLASMFVSVVSRSCWPLIHAVMSCQNVPAPTSPGIWSEPSNRNGGRGAERSRRSCGSARSGRGTRRSPCAAR